MSESELPLFPDASSEGRYERVAKIEEFVEGHGRAFPIANQTIAVFLQDGEFFAIDDFCPHQGASLAGGFVDGCTVACPWHYWRFSLKDGSWLDNPKISVSSYKTRTNNGFVEVLIPDER